MFSPAGKRVSPWHSFRSIYGEYANDSLRGFGCCFSITFSNVGGGDCTSSQRIRFAHKAKVRSGNCALAFTLVELLVAMAIVGILASLLLTAVSKARSRAGGMTCLNNLKQLGAAFVMYHSDSFERFPAPGSRSVYGPQPEDWIWWQYGRDVNRSTIAPFVSKFNARLFSCSADREGLRLQQLGLVPGDPYPFSYALTSYPVTNEVNPGMSTIITKERKAYYFRSSSISTPSHKIMLVEEDRGTIDDPRWVPVGPKTNLVAQRHERRGFVAFADGHVQKVSERFGLNPDNNFPIK